MLIVERGIETEDYVNSFIYIYVPLDQSVAYILSLFRKKNSVFPFLGKRRRFEGNKKCKNCIKIWYTLLGPFYFKIVLGMRLLAKMLAADQSNAIYIYINKLLILEDLAFHCGLFLSIDSRHFEADSLAILWCRGTFRSNRP